MKSQRGRLVVIVFCVAVVLVPVLATTSAYGEDKPSIFKDWDFQLAPFYLWAVNLRGDMTVKGNIVPVKVDFDDAFDNLEAVFTAHFEGWWRQKWGFLVDVSYVNLGGEERILDVDLENVMTELVGFYRFTKGRHAFEPLVGIRYTSLETEVQVLGIPFELDEGEGWVDPIIGARYKYSITEKWKLLFRGDIGGFSVGSDFTWNLVGLVDFQPWKHVSLFGGYRILDVDYESGSGISKFKYDVLMHGPLLGLSVVW
jgi:hypothetical protein